MELSTCIEKLLSCGWKKENTGDLPDNALNRGVEAYLTYKDRHSTRFLPGEKCIRLMIQSAEDRRCLQINYQNNLEQVLAKIISIKDEISTDSYLTHYLDIQSICPVSIMAVEQYE